jgi:hypothetical protein
MPTMMTLSLMRTMLCYGFALDKPLERGWTGATVTLMAQLPMWITPSVVRLWTDTGYLGYDVIDR